MSGCPMRRLGVVVAFVLVLGSTSDAKAVTVVGERVGCDPGVGIGGSNFNYFHGYLDELCVYDRETDSRWYPGGIIGLETGLVGASFAMGLTMQEGTEHVVTLPEIAFLARGRVLLPWGILGWERTLHYGGEVGLQILIFRAAVGAYWSRGNSMPHLLLGLEIGLL